MIEADINPHIYATHPEVVWALTAVPVPIHLKDPTDFAFWKGFLGITGHWRSWIPGYEEIACPFYWLIEDTQPASTHLLIWDPESEKSF